MNQIIELTISPTGETKLETKGFVGGSCRDASRFLEQALGASGKEQLTAEFHQQQANQSARQQQ
jgi:hypothetical protein